MFIFKGWVPAWTRLQPTYVPIPSIFTIPWPDTSLYWNTADLSGRSSCKSYIPSVSFVWGQNTTSITIVIVMVVRCVRLMGQILDARTAEKGSRQVQRIRRDPYIGPATCPREGQTLSSGFEYAATRGSVCSIRFGSCFSDCSKWGVCDVPGEQ